MAEITRVKIEIFTLYVTFILSNLRITQEAQQMVASAYKTAEKILTKHRDKLNKVIQQNFIHA